MHELRIEEHFFGNGRFAGVDVRDDADVPQLFQVRGRRFFFGHRASPTQKERTPRRRRSKRDGDGEQNAISANGTAFRRNETSSPTEDGEARNDFGAKKLLHFTASSRFLQGAPTVFASFPRFSSTRQTDETVKRRRRAKSAGFNVGRGDDGKVGAICPAFAFCLSFVVINI
jgi:hypothetical protein